MASACLMLWDFRCAASPENVFTEETLRAADGVAGDQAVGLGRQEGPPRDPAGPRRLPPRAAEARHVHRRGRHRRAPLPAARTRSGRHYESRDARGGTAVSGEFSARTRSANLGRMRGETFDILIIGGGIVGAGIAREA